MAEDSQADYANVPSGKKRRWTTTTQKILFLLVGLNMLGLVVQRWLIYSLHEKMEVLSLCMSRSVCQNLSDPQQSVQQGVTTISPVGLNVTESSEILDPTDPDQQRPLAHLTGANIMSAGGNNINVLQWRHSGGESLLSNMAYSNGRLLVQKTGYYYIYSKVTVNAAQECSPILHRVLSVTSVYDKPIELMRSKSLHCLENPEPAREDGENLWNSFLAGIFDMQSGDEIFVTVENSQVRPGNTENLMGAFMI
ncbi:tumor necrosis factor ligand superfamily member 14-like [Acanthopagrus latus]|uniref:tumor necrosis factor ligand superfamily member 14-like n=1 Tax=Acanthopagrus latus TaxID=8177 RepID=UPI00187BD493|nr:tumor necrosis factor ligand superfamily member 14-like [Acanthopagrus latus]XP_036963364.1 tumor necrosis factor ligand superfamily member 14-like [Acanthopagrus latus]